MLLIQGICHKFDEAQFLGSHALVDLHYQKAPTAINKVLLITSLPSSYNTNCNKSMFYFNVPPSQRKQKLNETIFSDMVPEINPSCHLER